MLSDSLMNPILDHLHHAFQRAIHAAFQLDADPALAPSNNPQFGDYQSNVAMGLVRRIQESTGQKIAPRAVAEAIVKHLDTAGATTDISIAGPGFINLRLDPNWLAQLLATIASQPSFGLCNHVSRQTIVIDYSAPNVAKEMHVGHLRSTIIGDCLARTFAFLGHHVIRQNHLGDWGTQFGMLIENLASRSNATTSQTIDSNLADLEGFYRAAKQRFDAEPDFAERARQRVVRLQSGQPDELNLWKQIVAVTRAYIQGIYARLNVLLTPDDERGESSYNPLLPAVVSDLRSAGLATTSDGATVVFVEGFEAPLIIQKTDGGFGYATTDLAAIRYRVGTLHADRVIYVVGLPQSQHFSMVFDVARRAGWTAHASLEHAGFGSVLGEDGKIFRTRAGGTVKLVDLLDEAEQRALALVDQKNADAPPERRMPAELLPPIARAVGVGAVKYFDLLRDRVGDYRFSFDAMLAMDGNTAPYLQYAYARIRSIFRRAGAIDSSQKTLDSSTQIDPPTPAALHLTEPSEIILAKTLLRFGEAVAGVARELRPHHLCNYLYDLAGRFSGFYEACPVLDAPEPLRSSRLALCDLTARVLATGLDLLGIEHPEQM